MLQRHFAWLRAETLRHGWREPEWLFPNDHGKPLDESRVRKVFRRGLTGAKLPAFCVYDLRHAYASLLLAAGAPITYVSTQFGHANLTTTLTYYAKSIRSKGVGGWTCWIARSMRSRAFLEPCQEPKSTT
jgi:integrase